MPFKASNWGNVEREPRKGEPSAILLRAHRTKPYSERRKLRMSCGRDGVSALNWLISAIGC